MGLFDFIFGTKRTVNNYISVEVTSTSSSKEYVDTRADKLAQEATQLKKEKKYEKALSMFEKSLIEAEKDEGISVAMRLRLSMFYQLAGKRDDSWKELSSLSDDYRDPHNLSSIYDKMRLQLQREKSFLGAIPYGIYSYIMRIELRQEYLENDKQFQRDMLEHDYATKQCARNVKEREQDVQETISKKSILIMLTPLLKKAKVEDKDNKLLNGVRAIGEWISDTSSHCEYITVHDLCKAVLLDNK